jgi:hypothetical protein
MSLLETIGRVKAHLQEHRRVSLRVLKREFDLEDDALDELVEELSTSNGWRFERARSYPGSVRLLTRPRLNQRNPPSPPKPSAAS